MSRTCCSNAGHLVQPERRSHRDHRRDEPPHRDARRAFLILCGLAPKIGALVTTIPIEVLGGGVIVMFGMVASAAVSILSGVDWSQRNMLIFGVALSISVGLELEPAGIAQMPESFRIVMSSGVLLAALVSIWSCRTGPPSRIGPIR